jgi:tetratricopeptide (TPR) repeat protein
MKRLLTAIVLLTAHLAHGQTPTAPAKPAPPPPQHEANFDAERKQANDLFLAGKILDSLPLYEDLCHQDQTIAVFAERHGAGLLKKATTLADPAAQKAMHDQGMAEIRRAQSLGDNSAYVQDILDSQTKNMIGSVMTGVPLTVGYIYGGTPEAQAVMKEAEAAFGREDVAGALKLYQRAAALDPKWYMAPLFAGDMYYRLKDTANAGIWFQKAIAIDPDRDTAWRYWGDALLAVGSPDSKLKFKQAFVAEPYSKPGWLSLQQWANKTKAQLIVPRILRPNFTTKDGVLVPDPALAAGVATGRSSWLAYETCRVKHGGLNSQPQTIVAGGTDANGVIHPSGYRHSLAEETECLRATLADLKANIAAGTVDQDNLDPSLKTLQQLDKDNMLECWILLNAADIGIRADYPDYRKAHRDQLIAYIDKYIVQPAQP